MTVIVEAWPLLSELFGGGKTKRVVFEMEVSEDYTLEDLINVLCERQPGLSQYFVRTGKNEVSDTLMLVSVVLNDEMITCREGFRTKLKEGDRIRFIQGFSGG